MQNQFAFSAVILVVVLALSSVEVSSAGGIFAPVHVGMRSSNLRLRGGEQIMDEDNGIVGWITPLIPTFDPTDLVPKEILSFFQPHATSSVKPAKAHPLSMRANRATKKVVAETVPQCEIDTVESTIEVDATPEEVFAVATNFLDYPKWAGGCQTAKILKDGPDAPELVVFDMGMFGMSMANTMQYKYEKPSRMTWTVTQGGVKDLLGIYEFKALANGRTQVTYKLRVDPGFPVPKMLRTAASKTIASQALKELKRYTEKLKKQEMESDTEVDDNDTAALRNLIALC
eukprot:CAMPEP_0181326864 /NCGR_PEP_ID=MMETSP1101-20121128/21754_1 /TAXON_ID=46948 /ORGANISM="Rhodomonas abbreviata, Strain Caron Lab Isolate" /LENGTH=286 /DNA_ID=CAMNT_0023435403 /DNA_START=68 /DNA_END=928 /DNA_ORIENTATION=-